MKGKIKKGVVRTTVVVVYETRGRTLDERQEPSRVLQEVGRDGNGFGAGDGPYGKREGRDVKDLRPLLRT